MYEFLLVFGIVLWVCVTAFYVRRPAASAFHPVSFYLLVHGVIFVVRPVLAYLYNFNGIYRLYEFTPSIGEKCTVLAAADLGFVVFTAVCLHVGRTPITFQSQFPTVAARRVVQWGFVLATVICAPIAIYSLIIFAKGQGGGGEMGLDMSSGIRYNIDGNGYFADVSLMVGPICVIAAWLFRFRVLALVPFVLFIAARLSTGQRGPMIVAFASLGLLFIHQQRRRWPTLRIIALLSIAVALFTVVGANRAAFREYLMGNSRNVDTANVFSERPLESMDYANMEFFEYLVYAVPAKSGTYGYFTDNLQVFTEPVPRALWHAKPLGAPVKMYSLFDYGTPIGMTMSVPGEGWAQAGWAGVVVWSALFGLLYGWTYQVFARRERSWFAFALYMIWVPETIVTLRDGVLLTIIKSTTFYVAPVVVTWLMARYVTARRPAPGRLGGRPVPMRRLSGQPAPGGR